MTDLIVVPQTNQWQRLKALVLDSVSSPITKRVYNLGLDEFFAWFAQEPRPGFTKATVSAWRVALVARGLGSVSINVRITAVRKLAAEAADNGLPAPELAAGIARVKSCSPNSRWLNPLASHSAANRSASSRLRRRPDRCWYSSTLPLHQTQYRLERCGWFDGYKETRVRRRAGERHPTCAGVWRVSSIGEYRANWQPPLGGGYSRTKCAPSKNSAPRPANRTGSCLDHAPLLGDWAPLLIGFSARDQTLACCHGHTASDTNLLTPQHLAESARLPSLKLQLLFS